MAARLCRSDSALESLERANAAKIAAELRVKELEGMETQCKQVQAQKDMLVQEVKHLMGQIAANTSASDTVRERSWQQDVTHNSVPRSRNTSRSENGGVNLINGQPAKGTRPPVKRNPSAPRVARRMPKAF